jgi:hypothetical protein
MFFVSDATERMIAAVFKYHERFLRGADLQLPEQEKTQKVIEKLSRAELDPVVAGRIKNVLS